MLKDLNEGVDKNMDKFELYLLRNIFKIPSGIKIDDINNESIEELLEEQRIEEMRLDKEISKAKERILQVNHIKSLVELILLSYIQTMLYLEHNRNNLIQIFTILSNFQTNSTL